MKENLDEFVIDQVTNEGKSIQDIIFDYPYKEVFGLGDDSYRSDEDGPKEQDNQETMGVYLQKMNAKINTLTLAV